MLLCCLQEHYYYDYNEWYCIALNNIFTNRRFVSAVNEYQHEYQTPHEKSTRIECTHIHFTRDLCIEYRQNANVLTIISMTMAHKKNKSCLPVHNATLLQKLTSQSKLRSTELYFLRASPNLSQQETHITSFHIPQHIAVLPANKKPRSSAHHKQFRTVSLTILHLGVQKASI